MKSIIYTTEGPQLIRCLSDKEGYSPYHACQLKIKINDVQEKLDMFFDSVSLETLIGENYECSCEKVEEESLVLTR